MGFNKEVALLAGHIVLGVGINEVLKGIEVAVPGSREIVTKIVDSLPVLAPAISWGSLKLVQGVKLISGADPFKKEIVPESDSLSNFRRFDKE